MRFPLPIVVCDEHRVPSLAPELLQPKLVRILDETLRRHGLDLRDMREADVEYEHIQ